MKQKTQSRPRRRPVTEIELVTIGGLRYAIERTYRRRHVKVIIRALPEERK